MDDEDRIERRKKQQALRDFAVVLAGYIVGQGVLRFFAALLVGLNDAPRAALVERWIPLWNSIGFFLLAWGSYHVTIWVGRLASSAGKRPRMIETQSPSVSERTSEMPTDSLASREQTLSEWKAQLKTLQKRKDVAAILELQESLSKSFSSHRSAAIDRRLGRWFTKHFQRMLMTGRAAECADDVELVAAHYADSEEFGYFREILPVVRQCAELKQSLQEEEQGD